MIDSLFLAWKYVSYNKLRTATLIACITLISFLPAALNLLLDESERQLMSRAASTPLVVGAKGSALDLMMSTLYFGDEVPETISMEAVEQVTDSDLATPIPMYVRFKARGIPIVGTSLDYFDFRGLNISQGRQLTMLGECVIGASAAENLELSPGDHLVSSPENLFDLAGVYPLKMKVVGVVKPTTVSGSKTNPPPPQYCTLYKARRPLHPRLIRATSNASSGSIPADTTSSHRTD